MLYWVQLNLFVEKSSNLDFECNSVYLRDLKDYIHIKILRI